MVDLAVTKVHHTDKTRQERVLTGPEVTATSASYYVQCQLQMEVTNTDYCILMSYHPETKSANYFFIERNNFLWQLMKMMCDGIIENVPIQNWPHKDNNEVKQLEEKNFCRIPDFGSLRPLRVLIGKLNRQVRTFRL